MKKVFVYGAIAMVLITNTSFHSTTAGENDFTIVIIKHLRTLKVYDADNNLLISYPVVFGNNDLGDKMMQGDRKTPEGIFHIVSKRVHEKWRKFMMLDYPNTDSYKKFSERKAEGLIPKNAGIGGSIGIHGTWPHEEFAIDENQNWTEGCISTKNVYIDKIYQYIPVGTQVTIKY
jgi:murein L,D-transpeptidase YafK